MKTIDKLAVLSVASVMLDQQPEVTTLEVKEKLRAQGFWAKQRDISTHMAELAQEQGWKSQDNGTHKVYSAHIAGTAADSVTALPTLVHSTVLPSRTIGAWEVNSTTDSTVMYIDGSQTRDQVRQIYKVTCNVKWENTRARKVK
jgi:hypothetical protein